MAAFSGTHPYSGPVPQPINVFMRIPVAADGTLSWLPASTAPGDAITLRAELDAVIAVSSCPQDLVGITAAHLLDAGHRALETHLDEVVALSRDFLGRAHPA